MPIDRSTGYEYINNKSHHLATNVGKVFVHRLVAERKLGRRLKLGEVVHHIDEDKLNNSIDNIMVFSSNSEHIKFHKPIVRKLKGCAECAEQTYNKKYCSQTCFKMASRKVERPSGESLAEDISRMSWCAIGRKYGVSDNSIRKWARNYGIIP